MSLSTEVEHSLKYQEEQESTSTMVLAPPLSKHTSDGQSEENDRQAPRRQQRKGRCPSSPAALAGDCHSHRHFVILMESGSVGSLRFGSVHDKYGVPATRARRETTFQRTQPEASACYDPARKETLK